jgi:hypothetical protein
MNMEIFSPAGGLYPLLGVLLFCAGTILGIPYGLAKRKEDAKRTELWRLAHASTCVGGVSVIALSAAMERLFGTDATFYLGVLQRGCLLLFSCLHTQRMAQ